jgi:hypothetical protein
MSEVYPKFIVEDGDLIISKVTYHREMATDVSKVKGGGWFKYDEKTNTFTFSGESFDFGKAKIEDIEKCVNEGRVYTNRSRTHSIAAKHKFAYDFGSEIIELKYKGGENV